jgi:hypothetical protein
MIGSIFDEALSKAERGTRTAFKAVTTNFLRNFKAENYESLAEELLNSPNSFPTNLGIVSDEHGEHIHQEISMMEK